MKKILLAAAFAAIPAMLLADIQETAGIIFPVLANGAGVRGTGMAGAFTAVADDAGAAYW